jgi:hypothetical protein
LVIRNIIFSVLPTIILVVERGRPPQLLLYKIRIQNQNQNHDQKLEEQHTLPGREGGRERERERTFTGTMEFGYEDCTDLVAIRYASNLVSRVSIDFSFPEDWVVQFL